MPPSRVINIPNDVAAHFREIQDWLRSVDRFSLPPKLEEYVTDYVRYTIASRTSEYHPESVLYRARIHAPNQATPYPESEMGAPPPNNATAGRINPDGIPYLYLADSVNTSISEVRPWKGAILTVGAFTPSRPLRIACLSKPGQLIDSKAIKEHGLAVAIGVMFELLYFSVPSHRDDRYGYLATQYIASKFRGAGVDGVEYKSVLHEGGRNICVFSPEACSCLSVKLFEVAEVTYNFSPKAV